MSSGVTWLWRLNGWVVGAAWASSGAQGDQPAPRATVTALRMSQGTEAWSASFDAPTRDDARSTPLGVDEARDARAALAAWLRAQAQYAETGTPVRVPWTWRSTHRDYAGE